MRLSRSALQKIINIPLNAVGLHLEKAVSSGSMPSWKRRMKLAKNLGFSPKHIFDGGGYKGYWSREVARLFPGAQIVIVEPNPFVQDELKKNTATVEPLPMVFEVALGSTKGSANLKVWRNKGMDAGASLLDNAAGAATKEIEVEVDTIDHISDRTNSLPDLVKLDLQGTELGALKGASRVLQHAEIMLIEFGCLEAYAGRTTPRDLMEVMYDNDYCLYDIVDCHYRPYDGALTGGDFFFVKNSSVLRQHRGWE